jgi:hypothetical protein
MIVASRMKPPGFSEPAQMAVFSLPYSLAPLSLSLIGKVNIDKP